MIRINENNIPEWSAYFDPNVFYSTHGILEIENWRMTNDQLEQYANDVMELRTETKEKVKQMKLLQPQLIVQQPNQNKR